MTMLRSLGLPAAALLLVLTYLVIESAVAVSRLGRRAGERSASKVPDNLRDRLAAIREDW
jgi:hypothetical protein